MFFLLGCFVVPQVFCVISRFSRFSEDRLAELVESEKASRSAQVMDLRREVEHQNAEMSEMVRSQVGNAWEMIGNSGMGMKRLVGCFCVSSMYLFGEKNGVYGVLYTQLVHFRYVTTFCLFICMFDSSYVLFLCCFLSDLLFFCFLSCFVSCLFCSNFFGCFLWFVVVCSD